MQNPFSGRPVLRGFLALLTVSSAITVLAKDFWEDKPFTEWSQQEAIKVLSESPWARTQTVMAGVLGGGEQQSNSDRVKSLPSVRSPGSNSGAALSQSGVSFGAGDSIPLYIRWHSSARIRQALGRLGQIQQNVPEAEIKKFVEAPVEDYQIAVTGPLLDAFNQFSLSNLQGKTFLTSKKNKANKLPLKNYAAPKDRQDGVALFSFSRMVDGHPALTAEDEEVEFQTQAGKISIKASFKLAKMLNEGKPDL